MNLTRFLPIGAEPFNKGTHFRLWAPKANKVEVILEQSDDSSTFELNPDQEDGYYSGYIQQAHPGTLYRFKLDGREELFPDPASRFQPFGPSGPSQIIDSSIFNWTDSGWRGLSKEEQVIYEMHVGTFTPKGTWESAEEELDYLKKLGITTIEMMPIHEFPGQFGWGYDGVNLFAPTHLYGSPKTLKHFIDTAHSKGLAVILDVVFNHLGPDGNYLHAFSDDYFKHGETTEWGDAINFDGPNCKSVREFFISNACYWIKEYHFDGLRLDAVHSMFDNTSPHILSDISRTIRARVPDRELYLSAENELQQGYLTTPIEQGGYGLDAVWNDDFHHSAHVRLTGRSESYHINYCGTPQEFIASAKYGYLYQGQWYLTKDETKGTPSLKTAPSSFIHFLQNHDQIANASHGTRIQFQTDPGSYRAMTALALLMPATPLLFQGQEFAASTPFYYFADHNPVIAEFIIKGRKECLDHFPKSALSNNIAEIPNPSDIETFKKCKLKLEERERHNKEYTLHKDLIALRRKDSVFSKAACRGCIDGAVLNQEAFLLRYFGDNEGDQRLLIINFGHDLLLSPAPEPLLAPPLGKRWRVLWSSEDSKYGGLGAPHVSLEQNCYLLGRSAVVLKPI